MDWLFLFYFRHRMLVLGARPLCLNIIYSVCAGWVFQEAEAEVEVECIKGLLGRPPEKGSGEQERGRPQSPHTPASLAA